MIRKCAQQIIKAAISPLTPLSGTAYPSFHLLSQQKNTFNLKRNQIDEEEKWKTSTFISAGLNPINLESSETSQCQGSGSCNSRVHGFKGEERSYFVLIAGLLLALNVAVRLSMTHDAHFHSYERKNDQ